MTGTLESPTNPSAAPPREASGALDSAAFRALADNLPVAAYLCDADGMVTYHNEPAARLWGRRPKLNDPSEKYCGSFRLRGLDGTLIERSACWMAETLRTGVSKSGMEVIIEREDGTSAHALAHTAPLRDAAGRIVGASNVLVDVTDRRRAWEAFDSLVASLAPKMGQDYFSSLVEALCGICGADYAFIGRTEAGLPYQVNSIAVSHRGQPMANFSYDLRGTPCANVSGRAMCHYPSGIQREFPEDKMLADMGIDSYLGAPLFSSARESLGLIVLLHTAPLPEPEFAKAIVNALAARTGAELERERAALALRESEARLAAVISHSPGVAVQWYSPEGRVLLWNRASEEMFGFKAEEALGKTLDQLIHTPEDAAEFVATCAEIARTGQPVGPAEYTFKRRSGEQGACLSTIFRIPGAGGGDWFVCMDIDITGRKLMEESLRESETRFRLFMDNNPAGAFVKDESRRYVYVSAAFERLIGLPREGILGKRDDEIFPLDAAEEILAEDRRALDLGAVHAYHKTFQRNGREPLHVWIHKFPFVDAQNRRFLAGVAIDEAERVRAAEQLRITQNRFKAIFNQTFQFIGLLTVDGRLLEVNRAALDFAGIAESEVTGKPFWETPWWSHSAELQARLREAIAAAAAGEFVRFEATHPGRDGEIHSVDFSIKPVRNEEGQVTLLLPEGRDITDRKRAEEATRRSEERFRLVAQATLDAHYDWDLGADKVWRSEDFVAICGDEAGREAPFGWWRERVHPEDREAAVASIESAFAGRSETWSGQYRFRVADGSYAWFMDRGYIEYTAEGKPTRFLGAITDMTEKVRAEEEKRKLEDQVRHAQKLESLGVLAGGIAHDFNNLLTAVLGHASLASMDIPHDSPARASLGEIEAAVQQAADLTRQMLAYSGRGKFVVKALELDGLVREMRKLLSTVVSKKAEFKLELGAAPMQADATQIRQVVMNLITNASDALDEKPGVISIRTGTRAMSAEALVSPFLLDPLPAGDYSFIEVSDTGCGMDGETLGKIFDPFFTTKFTGRGLGLAATLGIVRGHHGSLQVKSETGRGTTFTVYFPVSAGKRAASEAAPAGPRARRAGRGAILVVEDEEPIQRVARLALERAGYDVLLAGDGQAGIETFERRRDEIVAVLLDLTMPRKDGWEALARIQSASPGTPVLLMSGYNEPEPPPHFPSDAHRGFIQKPFGPNELIDRIGEILSHERR